MVGFTPEIWDDSLKTPNPPPPPPPSQKKNFIPKNPTFFGLEKNTNQKIGIYPKIFPRFWDESQSAPDFWDFLGWIPEIWNLSFLFRRLVWSLHFLFLKHAVFTVLTLWPWAVTEFEKNRFQRGRCVIASHASWLGTGPGVDDSQRFFLVLTELSWPCRTMILWTNHLKAVHQNRKVVKMIVKVSLCVHFL